LGALMAGLALWRPDTMLPIGLLLRLFGKDVLRLKWDRKAGSYWIKRADRRPLSQSMRQQF
jgi:hypothetical protein